MEQETKPPSYYQETTVSKTSQTLDHPTVYHTEKFYSGSVTYTQTRTSMSDVKLTEHDDSDDDERFRPLPPPRVKRKRPTVMDRICCGCCTRCPKWVRYCSCCILIIIVILGIVAGIIAAVFKVPTVSFNGVEGEPAASIAGSNLNLNFTLNISVDNRNSMGITFEHIKATAFYPGYHNMSIGGGEMSDVHIAPSTTTTVHFPFDLTFNVQNNVSFAILQDVLSRCGFGGGSLQNLVIDYTVTPTLRVAGVAISPTLSNSASIPCPRESLNTISANLTSLLPLSSLSPSIG